MVDARPPTDHSTEIVRRGSSTGLKMAIQFVILSIVGGGLFLNHQISLHLNPWSQAIVNGIVKYVYKGDGQADTTVVLFLEEHLAALGESYPVSYEGHAQVLEALSAYRPRAVFVDFAFLDKRSGQDVVRLNEAICGLQKSGTAVYLAAPPPPAGAAPRPPAVKTNGHGLRDDLQWSCFEVVTAKMDAEDGASGVLTYSNGYCASPAPDRPGRQFVWTPAFAMYARNAAGARLAPEDTQPMEIIWGNRVSELNEKWMGCTSERPLRHLYTMLRKNPLAEKRKCPHTNTISVLHLLGPVDTDVQGAIQGKAVFYGGSFQMVGDRVISPVFDDLPGVYLHAMAYDNLVTFAGNYKRADHEGLSLSSVVNGLLLLFTVLLLLLVDKPPAWAKRLAEPARRREPAAQMAGPRRGDPVRDHHRRHPDQPRRRLPPPPAPARRRGGPASGRDASAAPALHAPVPEDVRPRHRGPGGGDPPVPGRGREVRDRGGAAARDPARLLRSTRRWWPATCCSWPRRVS